MNLVQSQRSSFITVPSSIDRKASSHSFEKYFKPKSNCCWCCCCDKTIAYYDRPAYLYRLSKRATLSTLLYLSTSTISFWCVIVELLLLLVRCKSYQQFGFYCPPSRPQPNRTIETSEVEILGAFRVFTDFVGLSGGVLVC